MKKDVSVPSWLIILVSSLTAVIMACEISYPTIFKENQPPTALPPLPGTPVDVYQIDSWDDFRADPYIRTAAGESYRLISREGNYSWQIGSPAVPGKSGEKCSRKQISSVEAVTSAVVSCRSIQPEGDLCPSPLVSFAIDKDGQVWRLTENSPCFSFAAVILEFFLPVGFAVGLMAVLIRWVMRAVLGAVLK